MAANFETDTEISHPLISWRSVVAGLLITFFTMAGLLGLGLAMGGINMDAETSAKSVGIFTGVWFIASAFISLFVGSYFAARVSKFRLGRIGSAQGLVIASLFLGFFFYQIFTGIGALGNAAGSLLGKTGNMIGQGVDRAADSPAISNSINNMTEDALGDLNLKSNPEVVATGLGSRLLRGDTEGAKNYLASQAGISPTEADSRIAGLKTKVDSAVDQTKETAGNALQSTGWSLFLLVILGGLSGVLGGALGSVANFRNPLIREDFVRRNQHLHA